MKLRHALLAFAAGAVLSVGQASPSSSPSFPATPATACRFFARCSTSSSRRPATRSPIVPMPSSTTDQFGQYKLWLAAGTPTSTSTHRRDLGAAARQPARRPDRGDQGRGQGTTSRRSSSRRRSNGKLVALPIFTDAPALYYRKDLLDKYGAKVPTTWKEMADTAKMVMDKERAAGNKDMWGFVFQGNAYEGLTCDALEWVKSNGGGQIIEPDGTISINNPKAAAGHRDGQGLGRHHLAAGRARLPGRGVPRRLADRQRGLHAQLALRLCARQRRRLARSRASSTWRRCPSGRRRQHARRRRSAAGTSRCPSIRRTPRPRSSWSSASPRPRCQKYGAAEALATCRRSRRSTTMPTSPSSSRSSRAGRRSSSTRCRGRRRRPRSQVQRGLEQVLDARCTRRCPATARPPTTSSCSRPT